MNEIETTSNEPYGSAEGKDLVSGRLVFPLEHHEPRRADIDPKAAKRAEEVKRRHQNPGNKKPRIAKSGVFLYRSVLIRGCAGGS